jgi:FixJ family two-component response regulator
MSCIVSNKARALIADDQPDVLEALRLLLKGAGYQTETVNSPAAVIEALKVSNFDLLLMDLNYTRDTTSGQEGLDLLGRVRALDDTLPIVVMTAWGSIELTVEAMRGGVRDFILKPWENARLLEVLRAQIEFGHALRNKQRLKREIKALSNSISGAVDLAGLLNQVATELERIFQSSGVLILLRTQRGPLSILSRGHSEDLTVERRPHAFAAADQFDDLYRKMVRGDGGSLISPVTVKGDLAGFIYIGEKLCGGRYTPDEVKFLDSVVEQIGGALGSLQAREREQELEEARAIQRRLLPKQMPQISGFEISASWQPAHTVSGDYYDALKIDEGRVDFCIADVSGKGMPAALLMSNVQAAVKASASITTSPAEVCRKVNRVVCSNTADDRFITFFYCSLDGQSRRLVYTNAGHNPGILIRRDGTVERLATGGAVFGPFPDWEYTQEEVELDSGDRVFLFTDGITEVTNQKDEEFGEERLIELIAKNRELAAADLQSVVMKTVAEFSNYSFQDDATMIAISVE